MRVHLRHHPQKPVRGPKISKKVSFCRTESLEWRFGVHKATDRGPPQIAEHETHLWSLNRLPCGPRTGFQIGYFGLFALFPSFCLKSRFFEVFLYKFPFKMLNFGHNFGQDFSPSKTNLNSNRAVLWSLNRRSKWDPEIKQTKTTRNTKKKW